MTLVTVNELKYVDAFCSWLESKASVREGTCATADGCSARCRTSCSHRDWCPDCGGVSALLPHLAVSSPVPAQRSKQNRVCESTPRPRWSVFALHSRFGSVSRSGRLVLGDSASCDRQLKPTSCLICLTCFPCLLRRLLPVCAQSLCTHHGILFFLPGTLTMCRMRTLEQKKADRLFVNAFTSPSCDVSAISCTVPGTPPAGLPLAVPSSHRSAAHRS